MRSFATTAEASSLGRTRRPPLVLLLLELLLLLLGLAVSRATIAAMRAAPISNGSEYDGPLCRSAGIEVVVLLLLLEAETGSKSSSSCSSSSNESDLRGRIVGASESSERCGYQYVLRRSASERLSAAPVPPPAAAAVPALLPPALSVVPVVVEVDAGRAPRRGLPRGSVLAPVVNSGGGGVLRAEGGSLDGAERVTVVRKPDAGAAADELAASRMLGVRSGARGMSVTVEPYKVVSSRVRSTHCCRLLCNKRRVCQSATSWLARAREG